MSCERWRAWRAMMGPMLDGEIPAEDARRLTDHLAECGDCRERFDQMSRLSRSLRTLPRVAMPEALKESIREAPPAPEERARRQRRLSPLMLASLGGAALVVIIAVTLRAPAPPAPPTAPAPVAGQVADSAPATQAPPSGREEPLQAREATAPPAAPPSAPARPRPASRMAVEPQRSASRVPAAGPEAGAMAGAAAPGQAPVTPRYATTVILGDAGGALAPIVPQEEFSGEAKAEPSLMARADDDATARPTRAAAGEAPGAATASPRPAAPIARDAAAGGEGDALRARRGPAVALTFWIQLDADGRIIAAQPLGARTESERVVAAVAGLLKGATVSTHGGRGAMAAVVEVRLPAAPEP